MASSRKSVVAAVAADTAIALVKFAGAALTGSTVMVAEGIHSVMDGINNSLLLFGEHRAARPPTRRHPFGHGGEVYFWTVVVAMLGFVLGGGFAVVEGVMSWRGGGGEHRRQWMNFVVLGAAFVFDGISFTIALRELKRYQVEKQYRGNLLDVVRQSHNPPMFVPVLIDAAALVGVVIAAAGIGLAMLFHAPAIDAVAAVVDGGLMMTVAAILAWETRSLIVGEAARQSLLDDARAIIESDRAIARLDELQSLQLGPENVLLVLHARFAEELRAAEVPRVGRELESRLRAQHPSIQHLVFDFD